jgi:hypothetical protein
MASPLHDVCCASLPRSALPALAEVRCVPGVRAALAGERAWVRWEAGDEQVLGCVLPVAGIILYSARDGLWYRPGCHLPDFAFPAALDFRPLAHILTPATIDTLPAPAADFAPVRLGLVPDDRPRQTAAMECNLEELARWADTVPAMRLASIRAAILQGRLLLRGKRLPLLPSGTRYWGEAVLVPLGYRTEPELPESAVREALGVGEEEILLLSLERAEALPRAVFQPLTRAGIRRASGEGRP